MARRPRKEADQAGDASSPTELGPVTIVLRFPHGFIDDRGGHRFWHGGQRVDNPDEVALLRERGADFEED